MKLDKIIRTVEINELQRPKRAGLEQQMALKKLRKMNEEGNSASVQEVSDYLKKNFSSEDAKNLEKLIEK